VPRTHRLDLSDRARLAGAALVLAVAVAACGSAGEDGAAPTTVAVEAAGDPGADPGGGCPPSGPVTAGDVVGVPPPAPGDDGPPPMSGPYPVASPLDDGPLADAPALQQVLDDTLVELAGSPGAMALVWVPGTGVWRGGTGLGDVTSATPMGTGDHFHMGSATKPFTVMTVLRLVDQGLIGLDDPVSRWFPEMPDGDAVTVRQLAGMTSGIDSYTSSSEPFFERMAAEPGQARFTPEELVAWGLALPRVHAPGDDFFYTNTATVMLALIAEAVAGEPYPEVLQDEVLEPLGLTNTAFPGVDDPELPRPAIHGYFCDEGAIHDVTDWDTSWGHAAGAMTSTLDDLAVWSHQLGTGALVDPATFAAQTGFVDIGGGWGYGPGLADFGGWWGHNGGMPGYTTYAVYNPALGTVLVLNVNSNFDVATGATHEDGTPVVDTPATVLFRAFADAITSTPR
jgi:D-alanyl-D-alanine carboxypeptidase